MPQVTDGATQAFPHVIIKRSSGILSLRRWSTFTLKANTDDHSCLPQYPAAHCERMG